jgi:adenosylhomocysteine nucleosidase
VTRLAFVCAMPMEARPLARKLSLDRGTVAGLPAYLGPHAGGDVVVVVTGMGPHLAAAGAEALVAATAPDHVVVVGIAGALEASTAIGTVVTPEVVVDGATGVEHRPAPLEGLPSKGRMWTSATLITDRAALAGLIERGVVALEMETAAVAAVCEARGTPWSVVRVISDRASDGIVDEEAFRMSRQDGTPDPWAVVRFALKHPGRLPSLARMGRDATRAAATAADVAVRATLGPAPG